MNLKLLDCTLRDGGYYTNWDFPKDLIEDYLQAMASAGLDYVELGFRSFESSPFRGACYYTTDDFIRSLAIPDGIRIGVMMNASELVNHADGPEIAVGKLFSPAAASPVSLVRFACHLHEFETTLPACRWLKSQGYEVGINLMQVADRTAAEIERIGELASDHPLDVLYFADSLGGMDTEQTSRIIRHLRVHWQGEIGIHTHDSMGRAVANSLQATRDGATWVDSTVTGMGRGPGNAQTEYIVLELGAGREERTNLSPLLTLVRNHFQPMQRHYGWGKNPFYHLAGKYGIHPTFVQEMLADPRYGEAEALAVIEHLREVGGKKFSREVMEAGRQMYGGASSGQWSPSAELGGRTVLILGSGPGAAAHREAIERYIEKARPFVVALNAQCTVAPGLIDIRAACHPFRLLADCDLYRTLPQPLVAPVSRLPKPVLARLERNSLRDFGLTVTPGKFAFAERSAVAPSSLAVAYALALAASGRADRIMVAGFDGYGADDPRTAEMDEIWSIFQAADGALPIVSITPTRYKLQTTSVYAL